MVAPRLPRRREDGCDRVRERVGSERLARDRRRLQQRHPHEISVEAGCVRSHDARAVELEAHHRVLVSARGVADQVEERHPGQARRR